MRNIFMVKNFINNTHFFEWDEATHTSYFKRIPDAVEITIPKLTEMATEQVELASVPFATFINTIQEADRDPVWFGLSPAAAQGSRYSS